MIEIQLTQGKIAQVDDKFAFLNQHKWYAINIKRAKNVQYYAVRSSARLNGIQSTIRMHRVIMEHELGRSLLTIEEIDHINHDGLKNTLDNLRITTHQQNCMNSRKQNVNTSSRFKGVGWHKYRSKWQANIAKDGKIIYLGLFIDEEDAAHAVDTAAKLYYGEYANLNFPET